MGVDGSEGSDIESKSREKRTEGGGGREKEQGVRLRTKGIMGKKEEG